MSCAKSACSRPRRRFRKCTRSATATWPRCASSATPAGVSYWVATRSGSRHLLLDGTRRRAPRAGARRRASRTGARRPRARVELGFGDRAVAVRVPACEYLRGIRRSALALATRARARRTARTEPRGDFFLRQRPVLVLVDVCERRRHLLRARKTRTQQ